MHSQIESPDDPALRELCSILAGAADDVGGDWPANQLAACGEFGVYRWFLPAAIGGLEWDEPSVVRGHLALSSSCLTTTFVITQRTGACRRIAGCDNEWLKQELLPGLLTGELFATVGISHLTTSRRHLSKPVLRVEEANDQFVLSGFSPWVTGGAHSDFVVVGGTLQDDRQILIAVPGDHPDVTIATPPDLVGLTGSRTGQIQFANARLDKKWLIAGPQENIMTGGQGAKTGGTQTSTLAIGLGNSAVSFLQEEAQKRDDLAEPARHLALELEELRTDLLSDAGGVPNCSTQDLRARANSFVLRATQASLAAAKGSGYVVGHPTGRWCREALFFLVWSCPQPVMAANLCELAGIVD